MKVWEALARKSPVVTIGPDDTVKTAIGRFVASKIRGLPVTERERMVGIVTVRDVLEAIDAEGEAALAKPVAEIMTRRPVTVERESPLDQVEAILVDRDISHVPVLESGRLVGLLTPADVFACHLGDTQWLHENLQSYVRGGVR